MGETPLKYKVVEDVLKAASEYLETLAAIEYDVDNVNAFYAAENEAVRKIFRETPPSIMRILNEFVYSARGSFIKNRGLVETGGKEELVNLGKAHIAEIERLEKEREQEKRKELRRRKDVRKAHIIGFVVALFLAILGCCLKQGAFYYAISSAGCIATALGVYGHSSKAAKRREWE